MKKIIVQYGQSLYDLALQYYGCASAVLLLIQDNAQFGFKITDVPIPGTVLTIRKTVPRINATNERIAATYAANRTKVASGAAATLSEADLLYAEQNYWDETYASYP